MNKELQTRWVKLPGPGEMRGEGHWIDFDRLAYDNKWSKLEIEAQWNQWKNLLPVHIGDKPPS